MYRILIKEIGHFAELRTVSKYLMVRVAGSGPVEQMVEGHLWS